MFDDAVLDTLTVGTITGMGHSFGQRLISWFSRFWNRAAQSAPAPHESEATQEDVNESQAEESLTAEMVADLQKIETEKDYQHFVDGLKSAGVPLDTSASEQLRALQNEVLGKSASSQTLKGLADIAAAAMQRAGVEPVDLRRWQTLAERLSENGLEAAAPPKAETTRVPASVAAAKRPSTFWVWNRQEVDRRLTAFIKRVVLNCRAACEEFLASGDEMASLRKVRELRERLDIVNELLMTTPTLIPETRSLRIDGKRIKELVAGLEQGMKSAETLAEGTRKLLERSPPNTEWLASADTCLQAAANLNHNIRLRRAVR